MNELLSVEEASAIVGCSEITMNRHLRSGRLPGTKPGKSWVIPREALLERLNEIAKQESLKRRTPLTVVTTSRRKPLVTLPGEKK